MEKTTNTTTNTNTTKPTEFKRLKELSMEEIKNFKKLDVTFYKTSSRDRNNVNYNVKVHVVKNICDVRMKDVTQEKFMLEAMLLKLDLNTADSFKTGAYARFSVGEKDGKEFHLVEIVFNKTYRSSFFLNDNQIEVLKMLGKYNEFNWQKRPSDLGIDYLMPDEE